jgi:hypothetical protein
MYTSPVIDDFVLEIAGREMLFEIHHEDTIIFGVPYYSETTNHAIFETDRLLCALEAAVDEVTTFEFVLGRTQFQLTPPQAKTVLQRVSNSTP